CVAALVLAAVWSRLSDSLLIMPSFSRSQSTPLRSLLKTLSGAEFGNDSYEASDNFMTGRANGVLTYRNNDFFGLVDGLNIALQ
ncbi:porin, partial [Salmonella enterica subsp. enterica serovar Montevideo]|nr:porin [Salmonella enterica subsp. enterica serovar Montevideo]